MTVTTVFSSAASDGFLQSSSATYSIARAGTATVAVSDTDTFLQVGQFIFGIYVVSEAFLSFNTSVIPDTDAISSAALDLWETLDQTAANFTLRVRTLTLTEGGLVEGDFVPGADISSTGIHVASHAAGTGVVGAYNTFIDVAMAANINKDDLTQMFMYSLEQENNSAPAGNEFVEFSSGDESGTTQDPKLTITHASTVSRIPYTSRPMKLWRANNIAR